MGNFCNVVPYLGDGINSTPGIIRTRTDSERSGRLDGIRTEEGTGTRTGGTGTGGISGTGGMAGIGSEQSMIGTGEIGNGATNNFTFLILT